MVSPIEITVKATEKQNRAFRVYLALKEATRLGDL